VATERPERIAAAAAFIANRPMPTQCPTASEPVPMIIVNGTADPLMPYEGGRIRFGYGTVRSAPATRRYWTTVNRADTAAADVREFPDRNAEDGSVVVCETYPPQAGRGARVRFCRVEGGGHAMPSIEHQLARARRQNHDVEGARLAWSFFTRSE
jgi:polyhydroxybutyrate depolymerase